MLRRDSLEWTEEQRRWLADGLRHTNAGQLLLEFKYTEGLTFAAIRQLIAYDNLKFSPMEHILTL
ncbi:hypothetical protein TI05_08960, partial [Achromatium sp. WMS3]